MPEFTLTLFKARGGTTVMNGMGSLRLEEPDPTAATYMVQHLYPGPLKDCDYAKLTDAAGKLLWEKRRPDAQGS